VLNSTDPKFSFSKDDFWLIVIVLVSFLVKNPFIDQPFLGHFGSYQAIVAMIATEYAKQDFHNFLYPNSFLLVNGLPALEMIYYPFAAFVAAALWKYFGGSLDYWGRMQSMLFTATAIVISYYCAKKLQPNKKYALWVALFVAVSPMGLIYGRSFMNESSALCFLMVSFLSLQYWAETRKLVYLIVSGILFSVALILRLHFISAFLAYLFFIYKQPRDRKLKILVIFFITSFLLTGFWFWHTYQIVIHYSNVHTSLFVQLEKRPFPDILLLNPSFYVKVFAKEFFFRLYGPIVSLLMIASLFLNFIRKNLWILLFYLGSFLLTILSPSKFYDHPFYLLPLVFPGALLAASMMTEIVERIPNRGSLFLIALVIISNVVVYWKPAFSQPSDQQIFFEAVKYIRSRTHSSDRVLALHGTSTDFLYYLNRNGYSFQIGPDRRADTYLNLKRRGNLSEEDYRQKLEASKNAISWLEYMKQKNGTNYFAGVPKSDLDKDPNFRDYLKEKYTLVNREEDNFVLYRLDE